VSNAKVVLHWVSPNRPYASTFPSEPTYMSTPGLHMVHYDATAVDTHPGQNAARQSRLVNVVAVGAGERTNGAAGCPCLTEAQLRQKLGRHFSPTRDCLECMLSVLVYQCMAFLLFLLLANDRGLQRSDPLKV